MMTTAKVPNQQKIFDRLAKRFKDRIRDTISDQEMASLDDFLKGAFAQSPLRYSKKYNDWLFNSSQTNSRYIAWDEDEVVGTQYGLDCTIGYANESYNGSCAIDLSVDEKWRMKGLGVALIKKLMDNHDIVIGLGISDAAQAMFTKLGWHNLGQVNCYIKPLTTKGFSSAQQTQKVKSSVIYPTIAWGIRVATRLKNIFSTTPATKELPQVTNLRDQLNDLFTQSTEETKFSLNKNASYFEWRYINSPSEHPYNIRFIYQKENISSYLVTMVGNWQGKKVLAICDYFGLESDYSALIKLSEDLALSSHVDAIMYQGINPGFEQALKKSFFIKRPHGDLFMLHCNAGSPGLDKATCSKNWHITFADSDMDFMFFRT